VNANALLASLVVGSLGLGLLVYGKRQRRWPHLAAGIALMVCPYFVPSAALILVIAAALAGLLYLATRQGF